MDNSTLAGFIIVGLLIVIMGGMTFYFLTLQDTDCNVLLCLEKMSQFRIIKIEKIQIK